MGRKVKVDQRENRTTKRVNLDNPLSTRDLGQCYYVCMYCYHGVVLD